MTVNFRCKPHIIFLRLLHILSLPWVERLITSSILWKYITFRATYLSFWKRFSHLSSQAVENFWFSIIFISFIKLFFLFDWGRVPTIELPLFWNRNTLRPRGLLAHSIVLPMIKNDSSALIVPTISSPCFSSTLVFEYLSIFPISLSQSTHLFEVISQGLVLSIACQVIAHPSLVTVKFIPLTGLIFLSWFQANRRLLLEN